ncbi:NAD(P)/FAD-dependent oxidoreductase [Chitinophaga cymbidii]|uniref:FAD-dependent oxidoreductase n=1 Tax=Chitinophaga cymbidii TaxID=1096750 RepID=A0A512RLF5_9BACT|nr:FAD-dependent oxidoreductase [Chitinophaga cymbidii]GEP96490.1 FAD-dependent oxidoreductase [Chitinophaga cymbidii]
MLSYWEKQSLLHYDCIILGSGIVGLSTAISLKEKAPRKRILVLERGLLPTGASTKNAGFACIGSLTEILDDLEHMTPEEVVALVQLRRKGLQLLRSRIGDDRMQYRENGSYELISEIEMPALQRLDEVNALLSGILPGPAFSMADERLASFGFNGTYVKSLVKNNYEGELHTGMMMRTLIDVAIERGIEIKTGCNVAWIDETGKGAEVYVASAGARLEPHAAANEAGITFTASQAAVCTNAFAQTLLPEVNVTPGRGQVLITSAVKGLPFKGVFHFDKGYYYFRELNGRVLFGGGRNMDVAGETTTSIALQESIQQNLEEKLRTLILPHHPFTIEDRWAGIMAFGPTKQPLVQPHSDHIFFAVRMGGMGVAIGSEIGRQLAAMMLQNAS